MSSSVLGSSPRRSSLGMPLSAEDLDEAALPLPRTLSYGAAGHTTALKKHRPHFQLEGFQLSAGSPTTIPHHPAPRPRENSTILAGLTLPWITVQELTSRGTCQRVALSISAVAAYLVACIGFFAYSRGWTYVDAAYFVVVAIATVGYGDLLPTSPLEKAVSILMVFSALTLIATALGLLLDNFISGSPTPDFRSPSKWLVALELVLALCVIVLAGAVPYSVLEDRPLFDGVYWASMSVTTVGFGDESPKTEMGRAFAACYIFVGTLLTARALGRLVSFPTQLSRQQLEHLVEHQFGQELSPRHFRAIRKKVKQLPLKPADPGAVTQAEFTLAMLVSLGRIAEADIQECAQSFHALDTSGTGVLREADVHRRAAAIGAGR